MNETQSPVISAPEAIAATDEKKAWHAPRVGVYSVAGITAGGNHGAAFADGQVNCAS